MKNILKDLIVCQRRFFGILLAVPKLNKSSAYLSVPRREFEINMSGGSAPIQDRHGKLIFQDN